MDQLGFLEEIIYGAMAVEMWTAGGTPLLDSSALRLYTTTALTTRRIFTLMHDPQYRIAISWENVAYNQPRHPSVHIGNGMAVPARPNIIIR